MPLAISRLARPVSAAARARGGRRGACRVGVDTRVRRQRRRCWRWGGRRRRAHAAPGATEDVELHGPRVADQRGLYGPRRALSARARVGPSPHPLPSTAQPLRRGPNAPPPPPRLAAGNWSTDITGGALFGYDLCFVVLVSSLAAMLLQALSLRLGAGSGRDLAQLCRERYPPWASRGLWLLAECAIAACDLAEVLGCAIALYILLGLPLAAGVLVTAGDVLLFLAISARSARVLEGVICVLIMVRTRRHRSAAAAAALSPAPRASCRFAPRRWWPRASCSRWCARRRRRCRFWRASCRASASSPTAWSCTARQVCGSLAPG